MKCPFCGSKTKVVDTWDELDHKKRVRKCLNNEDHKFNTVETYFKGDKLEYRKSEAYK